MTAILLACSGFRLPNGGRFTFLCEFKIHKKSSAASGLIVARRAIYRAEPPL